GGNAGLCGLENARAQWSLPLKRWETANIRLRMRRRAPILCTEHERIRRKRAKSTDDKGRCDNRPITETFRVGERMAETQPHFQDVTVGSNVLRAAVWK